MSEMPDYQISKYEDLEQMEGEKTNVEKLLAERLKAQHEMMDGNQVANAISLLDRTEREEWPDIPVLDNGGMG